jgi:hypothetical protein
MEDADFLIPLSTFESKDDNKPAHHEMRWQVFARRLCRYDERPNKDGLAWSPVTYLPDTTRGKANVDAVHALVLDVDHAPLPLDLLEEREYVAHTTFQHTPEAPRWRVVLPLERSVSGADWPGFWLRANAFFGGCVDPATKDSSRIFYLPSCPPGAQHEVKQQHGALLDPDELPAVPTYEAPEPSHGGHKRSVVNRGLADWAARFALDRCVKLAGIPRDSGRNDACNRAAHVLGGLAVDPVHDLREEWLVEQLFEACGRNGLIEDDGRRSVEATIKSGLESGRLRPWSPGDTDPLLPSRKYERSTDRPPLYAVGDLRLNIVRMSEVQEEQIHWMWRGRLAFGKLTLLMGDPGLGKSLISHWLAAVISTGGEWPDGGAIDRSAAIVFTIEDALGDTVKPRLIAAGANMDRVLAVRGVVNTKAKLDERLFTLDEHIGLLEQHIQEEGARLVVMDPVSAYLGANVNAHKESDVRRVLGPLGLMAERTGVAILNLIHLNKGKDVAALNRATGSVAFPAVSRMVLGVVADPTDQDGERRLLLPLKCNVSRKPQGLGYRIETAPNSVLRRVNEEDLPPILVWDDEPVLDDIALALDRGSITERTQTEAAVSAIAQIFANNGSERILSAVMNRELKDAGVSTSSSVLDSAKRQLGVRSMQPGGLGTPWYWYPPKRSRYVTPRAYANHTTETGEDGDTGASGDTGHNPHNPHNPPVSPSSNAATRARDDIMRYCIGCQRNFEEQAYLEHLPCDEVRCPVHHKRFDEHDCDQL